LRYEYLRAERYSQYLGCIMVDVDYFKSVNDTHGHQVGDETLKQLAWRIRGATRHTDIVARYGGEEFAVLLPNTSALGTQICAEHIWHRIGTAPIEVGKAKIHLTVSVGVSTLERGVDDAETLLRRADEALYTAKRRGRNNVCVWVDSGRTTRETAGFRRDEAGWREDLRKRIAQLNVAMNSRCVESLITLFGELTASRPYLAHDASNVSIYAVELAQALRMPDHDIESLRAAVILHDLGMMVVPREIVAKAGPLEPDERRRVMEHADVSAELAGELRFLRSELAVIRHHHERFDGSGYPMGLKGEQIPLGARILAIADAYNSMINERPYRRGISRLEALEELRQGFASQFDPRLAEVFVLRQTELLRSRSAV